MEKVLERIQNQQKCRRAEDMRGEKQQEEFLGASRFGLCKNSRSGFGEKTRVRRQLVGWYFLLEIDQENQREFPHRSASGVEPTAVLFPGDNLVCAG